MKKSFQVIKKIKKLMTMIQINKIQIKNYYQ